MTFTYTLTCTLDTTAALPPVAGSEEQRAYWVTPTILAWPLSLLPRGMDRGVIVTDAGDPLPGSGLALRLITAPDGGAAAIHGRILGADGMPSPTLTPLRIVGNLPGEILAAHPNLEGYIALSTTDAAGTPLLDDGAVASALTGQVAIAQYVGVPDPTEAADVSGARLDAFTGVQTAILLDHLYAEAATRAELGVTFHDGRPSFALWAPTAQAVTLLTWETGDPLGSVPEVPGPPRRTPAIRSGDGRWVVANRPDSPADTTTSNPGSEPGTSRPDAPITAGCQYLWEVRVYVPSTRRVETNIVTDPYSTALTTDSTRSVAIDLADPRLAPEQWATTRAPAVRNDSARSIYELHLRDFSAADGTVPPELRGTYRAFTVAGSAGVRHLAELARAGMNTIHLLPTFDIATIPEHRGSQRSPSIPAGAHPASADQQAAIAEVADDDAYNWGYDPLHWGAPEGSYATEGHQDGGARVVEFREMVGALHDLGLQVVLDQVYNHTAACGQDPRSVLDRVVPGYYHRLDAVGRVTSSTCCANTATENALCARLMVDSVVRWARWYRVDGFRFDLMGHHPRAVMERVRAALDELTLEADGVDGRSVYLYGEGWNFGEVAGNALFVQATQGQLDGTGIGAFNDRLRDAVHGGGAFDPDHRVFQGFGTGLLTQPSGLDHRGWNDQSADLAHRTDLVRLGLAGNLKDYVMTVSDGTVRRGIDLIHNGAPAAFASHPQENVNYVDAHDNETLYDLLAYKLPQGMPVAERVRMNTVCLATVALAQSPAFWSAGTELLRSKSLDRDSYNSGDWFNAIDFTGQSNGFGRGLPPASRNEGSWAIQGPLLQDDWLRPSPEEIAAARSQALDLLRLRASTPLFSLGSARLIQDKLSFPGAGFGAPAGVIVMLIDDTRGGSDVDPELDAVLVVFNASGQTLTQPLPELAGRDFRLSPIQAEGGDEVVRRTGFDRTSGTISVPARTVAVLVQRQTA
ncbi:pullulanase-type alpha-1,6-glucosidase [Actinomyces sp. oral taxon 171]|uniref:pullulanase-type alpha-1,6-glucosidase n=2 Tax=Actinomyces sp. oral taxon 171 TaxID=706438 RepID=UPI0010FBE13C|nr:pullulanase-type alpha-1,6-glucosidase [Actinomyces sp. oral taxon 171]QCT34220.1 pullulanase-type alpha-1,6-glucosidase [Actinomyces sp. oral taxon 171 str. F0337]